LKDTEGIGISLSNIGLIYQKQKKYNQALENYQQSLEVFTNINFLIGRIYALHNVGTSYADLKNYSKALDYYQQSLDLARQKDFMQGILANYEAMSNLHHETGNYKNSLEFYKLYDNLKDSISSVDAKNQITEMEALYKLGLMDNELARKSIELQQQRRQKQIFFAGSLILLILWYSVLLHIIRKIKPRRN